MGRVPRAIDFQVNVAGLWVDVEEEEMGHQE